ncbi:MAG: hypothetical protein PWP23_2466 [Candidatus Sumerlaeota bacterium]|nr:hypothetical protein [Candidatus Sumerlaeota bacterium]
MKFIALIPLRGGSMSIPRKNIRPLAGRPLCDWVIRAAMDSGVFAQVWVSTDDDEIAAVAARCGALVHRRAPETATATASSESALLDFAKACDWDFDVLALVQATSPLTRPEDFRAAAALFEERGADSLVTTARQHRFRWQSDGTPLNYDPVARPRRQDWSGELVENGAFYFTHRQLLRDTGCRLGGVVAVHEMAPVTAFEIDEPDDWYMLESLARRHGHVPEGRPIRLFVMDVDGVLNDAGFYYSETGEALKKFNTRDGAGLDQLRRAGIERGIITGESTGFAPARARKLGIGRVELGCKNKLPVLDAWRRELGLEWDEIAYIGDDLADIPCIKAAGVGASPRDGQPEVLAAADYVCTIDGGKGAVRDFIRYLAALGRLHGVE